MNNPYGSGFVFSNASHDYRIDERGRVFMTNPFPQNPNDPKEIDIYAFTGIPLSASFNDIRRVEKTLLLASHPDKGGNKLRFILTKLSLGLIKQHKKNQLYQSRDHSALKNSADQSYNQDAIESEEYGVNPTFNQLKDHGRFNTNAFNEMFERMNKDNKFKDVGFHEFNHTAGARRDDASELFEQLKSAGKVKENKYRQLVKMDVPESGHSGSGHLIGVYNNGSYTKTSNKGSQYCDLREAFDDPLDVETFRKPKKFSSVDDLMAYRGSAASTEMTPELEAQLKMRREQLQGEELRRAEILKNEEKYMLDTYQRNFGAIDWKKMLQR